MLNESVMLTLENIMRAWGATYSLGQKVIYKGNEDEIEAYCPLWESRGLNQPSVYIGMGYNLKISRQTVMGDEFKVPSESLTEPKA